MPDWRDEIRARLAGLGLDPASEAQIVEELAQHLEDRYAELAARGESPEAAWRATLEELAESEVLARELRARWNRARPSDVALGRAPARAIDSLVHDLRYAARTLRASPGYTAAAVVTLALGIGACTLIFGVANGVLLRPLPFRQPERLVAFYGIAPEKGLRDVAITEGLFAVYRQRTRTLESIAIYSAGGFNLTGACGAGAGACEPERIDAGRGSADFFKVLGVKPLLGRTFLPGEDTEGKDRVAVLGHALWKRRFGGRADVVGRTIDLSGQPATG